VKTFRFLDFQVYKDAKIFYKQCVSLTRKFPRDYWELGDQLRRAAVSVCLNIAEGSAKYSDRDFKRFIENSLGSINEAVACLDIVFDNELISSNSLRDMKLLGESITKQLGGLSKKLRSPS